MNPYQKQAIFFLKEADRHWKTAQSMFSTGHYDWALFVARVLNYQTNKFKISAR